MPVVGTAACVSYAWLLHWQASPPPHWLTWAAAAAPKQAKTKSFSKEGLNRAALDPKERARAEMRDWLSATVDTLNTQVGAEAGGLRPSAPVAPR